MNKKQQEKYKTYQDEYHSRPENRAKARLRTKEWRIKNPERTRLANQAYREAHPEKVKAWNKKGYKKWKAKRVKERDNERR